MKISKKMPGWLKEKSEMLEEDKTFVTDPHDAYSMGFQKCYELMQERVEYLKISADTFLQEMQKMDEQQKPRPIETAPKDGRDFIGIFYYDQSSPYKLFMSCFLNGKYYGKASNSEFIWEPTHWLPLPDLSEVESEK